LDIPLLLNVGLDINRIDHDIIPIYNLEDQKIEDYHCELKLQVQSGTIYLNLSDLGQLDEIVSQIQEARNSWTEKFAELEVKRIRRQNESNVER
jgi:hypothetical protein